MSRITELESTDSLPSDRCVFPVRKGLVLSCLMLACLLCSELSAVDNRKESALTHRIRNELAYLKTQNILTPDTVSRYRELYLEMPAQLSPEEMDALEQYQQEYSRLRKASELAKAEKMFERYAQLNVEPPSVRAEEGTHLKFLQQAPAVVTKKPVAVEEKKQAEVIPKKIASVDVKKKAEVAAKKKAAVQASARKKVEYQMKRELAALYPRAYALTSKRILVSSAKEKDKYASEFASAVKLFEDWLKKWNDQAKRKPYLSVTVKAQSAAAEKNLTFLKECQAIHELAYKGGTKLKGRKLDRYRIVSTNWQGIEYADAGNHYQSRLKAANLNSAVKMHLIAQSARKLKKNTLSINGIPLLAYYHVLTGNADIVVRLDLKEEQKQRLVDFFKDWNLPEKEKQILVKPEQKKAELNENAKKERF